MKPEDLRPVARHCFEHTKFAVHVLEISHLHWPKVTLPLGIKAMYCVMKANPPTACLSPLKEKSKF